MNIWYSSYQLYPKNSMNSQSRTKFRTGALLRVRFEDESVGYADVCPFPEMGDRPVELELKQISLSKPTHLGARSLAFARLDATARAQGVSLFDSKIQLVNHFLISDIFSFDTNRIAGLVQEGYLHFKVKMGRDLANESLKLENLVQCFGSCQETAQGSTADHKIQLRLDFNASLSRDRFLAWLDKNQKGIQPYLEFIEDPCPYDFKEWLDVGARRDIRLALDLAADPVVTDAVGADIVVVKPAVQDVESVIRKFKGRDKKIVMTHYMDFPVGQMCALYSAQRASLELGQQMLVCGLQHHDVYEGFTFQDEVKSDGPIIVPPAGTGLGFDKLLERLKWSELS